MGQPSAGKRSWLFGNFYANLSFEKSKITLARPATTTCLMFELVYLIRHFTGPTAAQTLWAGQTMPATGEPHWSHVAAFVNAAGLQRDGRREIFSWRQCMDRVNRLLDYNLGLGCVVGANNLRGDDPPSKNRPGHPPSHR